MAETQMARCGFCGWEGPHPWQIAPPPGGASPHFGVRITRFTTVCPKCGRERLELVGLWDNLGRALHEADLTAEEIELFRDALDSWPEATPEELAEAHPYAVVLIKEAERSGGVDWKFWLILVLMVLSPYMAHYDATHPPDTGTRVERTGDISKRMLGEIIERVEAAMEARQQQSKGQAPRHDRPGRPAGERHHGGGGEG